MQQTRAFSQSENLPSANPATEPAIQPWKPCLDVTNPNSSQIQRSVNPSLELHRKRVLAIMMSSCGTPGRSVRENSGPSQRDEAPRQHRARPNMYFCVLGAPSNKAGANESSRLAMWSEFWRTLLGELQVGDVSKWASVDVSGFHLHLYVHGTTKGGAYRAACSRLVK